MLKETLLTDDEIVAVAARLDAPWRTVIPTIVVEDAASVAAAVVRGSRSLFVRGLLDADSDLLHADLLELLQAVGDRRVVLAAYACSPDGELVPGTPSQYFFGGAQDSEWICDSISGGGVHTLSFVVSDDVVRDAGTAFAVVHERGTGVPDRPDAVFTMVSQRDSEVRQAAASKGEIALALLVDGTDPQPAGTASPDQALRWLLGQ